MADTTARAGLPFPQGGDPNDVPADMQALAERVATLLGAPRMSTLDRDALGGNDLYDGRTIYNTDTDTVQIFDEEANEGAGGWRDVAGVGVDLQVFTTSGTWIKPAGAKLVVVEAWGGGGAGNGTGSYGGGNGGAGGGQFVRQTFPDPSVLGSSESVTVGAGGSGVNSSGGSTSFGDHITADNGNAGTSNGGTGGAGGSPAVIAEDGGKGGDDPGNGASTYFSGAGGGGGADGTGGTSRISGGHGGNAPGGAGMPPGGGGAADPNASAGGDGGRGEVRVISYF